MSAAAASFRMDLFHQLFAACFLTVSRWSTAVAGVFVRGPVIIGKKPKVFKMKRKHRTTLPGCFLVCLLLVFDVEEVYAQSSCKNSSRFCVLKSPVTCEGVYHEMVEREGADNPMDGVYVGSITAPTLIDQDNDGDFDMWVGNSGGLLHYFENTGNKTNPAFTPRTGADNPMNGEDVEGHAAPTLIDQDNDGDFDMWVGSVNGQLHYFENTGNNTNPVFTPKTGAANPMNSVDVGASRGEDRRRVRRGRALHFCRATLFVARGHGPRRSSCFVPEWGGAS